MNYNFCYHNFFLLLHTRWNSRQSEHLFKEWSCLNSFQCSRWCGVRIPLPPHNGHDDSSAIITAERINSERLGIVFIASKSDWLALKVIISDLFRLFGFAGKPSSKIIQNRKINTHLIQSITIKNNSLFFTLFRIFFNITKPAWKLSRFCIS